MSETGDAFAEPAPRSADPEEYASVTAQRLIEEDVIGLLADCKPADAVLKRSAHADFNIFSLTTLPSWAVSLDASRPWLCFWIVHALALLNRTEAIADLFSRIVAFLIRCRHPDGGFGGGPGQIPHLAPTYAAVMTLIEIGTEQAYAAIDRPALRSFLMSMKQDSGAFVMHDQGETDVRATYCALAVAAICRLNDTLQELKPGVAAWIRRCQTYEGAFGGEPGNEAHGGYAFCGLASLLLLGELDGATAKRVLRWASRRQLPIEGVSSVAAGRFALSDSLCFQGFQGRTNKLVDSCYSFWVGGIFPLADLIVMPQDETTVRHWLFGTDALRRYILCCCQSKLGGIKDKPDKSPDLYHTAYALSGLAITEHPPGAPVDPADVQLCANNALFNVTDAKVAKALDYFSERPIR